MDDYERYYLTEHTNTEEKKKSSNVTKFGLTILVVLTVILSGVFGFAGASLSNGLFSIMGAQAALSAQREESSSASDAPIINNIPVAANGTYTVADIADMNGNSVVEIQTESVSNYGRFGQFISDGAGSGVIISSDGYIVTNNHVIEGARKVTVRLKNGESYQATVLGRDQATDLALIKITAAGLTPAVMGDSDILRVGEPVVAIGNPLGELGGTVTEGIISATSRDITIDGQTMSLLQTSAAINPGNSGGGLFNGKGELIGVVNAKSSGSGIEGLGFAIPVNTAKEVIERIKAGESSQTINLGLTLININDDETAAAYRVDNQGVYVLKTENKNELMVGDRIVSIEGTDVSTSTEARDIIQKHKVGDIVTMTVERDSEVISLDIMMTAGDI